MNYQPAYANSWALVIGIDAYTHCSPLNFGTRDFPWQQFRNGWLN